MKIGILSDMHGDADSLIAALKILGRAGVSVVICCGDVVDAGLVPLFAEMELHLVEGNVDHSPRALARAVERLGNDSTFGLEYTATWDSKHIAVLHGHLVDRLIEVVHSGLYDYVFHGHTHRRRDERIGATRVINPGALGGKRDESRSFAMLDLATDQLRVIEIGS
jgi:putative phosphoesterase